MAALPTSLPATPAMLGADDGARQEYFDALQKTLAALEARASKGPNMFEVAGAFLDPGRTGSFGESVGRAANVVGQQQNRQAEMAIPLSQMRAQLAGQKYEVANQGKALQLLSSALGVAPQQVESVLSSGNLPPGAAAKLAQVYPVVSQLSPKVGEIVKNTFSMQKDLSGMAVEDRKAGMTQAEMVAKYGADVLNLIPGGGMATPRAAPSPGPMAPPAAGAPATTAPTINQGMPQAAAAAPRSAPPPAAPPTNDLSGLPLGAQGDVARKRVEEADKSFNQKRDEILNFTPQMLESSNTNLRQLDYYASKFPQVFGLMQQQGVLSGIMTAAQEGAQLTAGDFNARLGLPVKQFLEKVKLDPREQQAVRDVTRILGSEFLSNVRANKGLLGVNPTDNDARLLQAPMASTDDSSRAVQLWSRQQLLLNKQRGDLYKSYNEHADTAGAAASPRMYFRPGSVYERINNDYAKHREQLFNQFNPR